MNARDLKAHASAAVARGRFRQAEVLYRQALTLVPRDAQAWLKHGETLRQLERPIDAVESYRMAATIFATDGHYSRAVASMRLALELTPDDVDVVSELIRLEVRQAQTRDRPLRSSPSGLTRSAPLPSVTEPIESTPSSLFAQMPTPAPQLALPMLVPPSAYSTVPTPLPRTAPEVPIEAEEAITEVVTAPVPPPLPDNVEVRRLSDSEVAMKITGSGQWVVVSSVTPLMVRYAEQLESTEKTA